MKSQPRKPGPANQDSAFYQNLRSTILAARKPQRADYLWSQVRASVNAKKINPTQAQDLESIINHRKANKEID